MPLFSRFFQEKTSLIAYSIALVSNVSAVQEPSGQFHLCNAKTISISFP